MGIAILALYAGLPFPLFEPGEQVFHGTFFSFHGIFMGGHPVTGDQVGIFSQASLKHCHEDPLMWK